MRVPSTSRSTRSPTATPVGCALAEGGAAVPPPALAEAIGSLPCRADDGAASATAPLSRPAFGWDVEVLRDGDGQASFQGVPPLTKPA